MLGVGDESPEIRRKIFSKFTSTLDHLIIQCSNLHCLIEGMLFE